MKATLALLLFTGCCFLLQGGGGFYLNDAERVVIYGDDPGAPRLDAAFLAAYIATRFPYKEVELIIVGKDAAPEPAILAGKPTVLVLVDANNPTYSASYELTLKLKLVMPSLRVTTIPYLAPQFSAPTVTSLHLLASWNAPALVSAVEIDAGSKRVARSENTTVRELESDLIVAWSQDDLSLPLPSGTDQGAERMNIETLQVRGLGSGKYHLTIDGWSMGEFWRESLENGIDLTLLPTPMLKQADRVRALMLDRGNSNAEWRKAALPQTHDYEIAPVNR
jgi:hypothetical protein